MQSECPGVLRRRERSSSDCSQDSPADAETAFTPTTAERTDHQTLGKRLLSQWNHGALKTNEPLPNGQAKNELQYQRDQLTILGNSISDRR